MLSYRPSFATAFSASSRLVLPVASLLVWGAVAFSAVTWGLRWSAMGTSPSNGATATQALPEVDVSAAAPHTSSDATGNTKRDEALKAVANEGR